MTDAVSIANRALSKLGTQKTIASFTDPTPAATQCGLWYDTVRRALLRTAPWGFARQQVSLTQLGDAIPDNTSPYPWLYMYAYPGDCIKMRYVIPTPQNVAVGSSIAYLPVMPRRDCRFLIANNQFTTGGSTPTITNQRAVLTNVCQAIGVYTYDAQDPNTFDPLFETAFISALAAELVMPLTGNAGMVQGFRADCEAKILQARAADGNEAIPKADHTPDWIRTREVGGLEWGTFAYANWGEWYAGWDNMSWSM